MGEIVLRILKKGGGGGREWGKKSVFLFWLISCLKFKFSNPLIRKLEFEASN